jgi:MFS family permease
LSPRAYARRRPNRTAFAGVFAGTLLCFLAIGAVLPVLPRYVTEELGGSDVQVGLVTGVFAFTALVGRPFGGRLADRRGRRPIVLWGMALAALGGALYSVSLGVAGLVVARLVLGVGQGWVFTAGLAWAVDLAPLERRGQVIGFFGLGVWGGLSCGPPIGEALRALGSYELVWAFAALAPVAGMAVVRLVPDRHADAVRASAGDAREDRGGILPREAVAPGVAIFCAAIGFAALTGFVVLLLDDRGIGHGAAVFTAFATTVVLTRLALSPLPDRVGPHVTACAAAVAQAAGLTLIAVAQSVPVAVAGALAVGAGFSLSFPSLALVVVQRVDEHRRGAAMGAFTAFFDLGVGLGAPLAGLVSALGGYPAAFGVAAAAAAAGAVVAASTATPAGRLLTVRTRPSAGR